MRRDISDIEIKEPPLRELGRKSSCLKRGCVTLAGCVGIAIVGYALLARYSGPPRPRELKDIPDDLAARIPLYDKKNINRIVFTSPSNQSRAAQKILLLPKAVARSLARAFEKQPSAAEQARSSLRGDETGTDASAWQEFMNVMNSGSLGGRDAYEIEWTDLSAKPEFLQGYYSQQFEKMGFAVANVSVSDTVRQFSFSKDDMDGSLFIEDKDPRPGTDEVLLTVRKNRN